MESMIASSAGAKPFRAEMGAANVTMSVPEPADR